MVYSNFRPDIRPCAFCSERIGVKVQHARGWDSPNHLSQAFTGSHTPLSLTARIDQHYDEQMAHEDREVARRFLMMATWRGTFER